MRRPAVLLLLGGAAGAAGAAPLEQTNPAWASLQPNFHFNKPVYLAATRQKQVCQSYEGDANLNRWCTNNCAASFCPADKCRCLDSVTGAPVVDAAVPPPVDASAPPEVSAQLVAAVERAAVEKANAAAAGAAAAAARHADAAGNAAAAAPAVVPATGQSGPSAFGPASTSAPSASAAALPATRPSRVYDQEYQSAMATSLAVAPPTKNAPDARAPLQTPQLPGAPTKPSRVYDDDYMQAIKEQDESKQRAKLLREKEMENARNSALRAKERKQKEKDNEANRVKNAMKTAVQEEREKELASSKPAKPSAGKHVPDHPTATAKEAGSYMASTRKATTDKKVPDSNGVASAKKHDSTGFPAAAHKASKPLPKDGMIGAGVPFEVKGNSIGTEKDPKPKSATPAPKANTGFKRVPWGHGPEFGPHKASLVSNEQRKSEEAAAQEPVAKDAFWAAAHPKRANEATEWAKVHPKRAKEAQIKFDKQKKAEAAKSPEAVNKANLARSELMPKNGVKTPPPPANKAKVLAALAKAQANKPSAPVKAQPGKSAAPAKAQANKPAAPAKAQANKPAAPVNKAEPKKLPSAKAHEPHKAAAAHSKEHHMLLASGSDRHRADENANATNLAAVRTQCTSLFGDAGLSNWCRTNCPAGLCPEDKCICGDTVPAPTNLATITGAVAPKSRCRALVATATDTWCENTCSGGRFCPTNVCQCDDYQDGTGAPSAELRSVGAPQTYPEQPPVDGEATEEADEKTPHACPCTASSPVCGKGYCYPTKQDYQDGKNAENPFVTSKACSFCDSDFPAASQESADDVPCEGAICVPDPTNVTDPNANATDGSIAKTFRLQILGRRARAKSEHETSTTIAIGFLTRGDLPLFENVWGTFFRGCNGRAAVPIVHSQAATDGEGGRTRRALSLAVEKYGGLLVPSDKTVFGEMRFSFNMVKGMFALVHTASTHAAPNGRIADWIHFASERCAPVRPCPALQRFLDKTPGVNHLESSPSTSVGVQKIPEETVPDEFRPLTMTSQWATLWMQDALALARDEDRLREKWAPRSHPAPQYGIGISQSVFVYGAPDEWMWHTELAKRNATISKPGPDGRGGGLTNVHWCRNCNHVDNSDGFSPAAYLTYEDSLASCQRAQDMNDFFARKFGNSQPTVTPLVEKGLLECHKQDALSTREDSPPKPKNLFTRLMKEYPRTRAEAMVLNGKAFWTNASVSFHLHMQRGEGGAAREQ